MLGYFTDFISWLKNIFNIENEFSITQMNLLKSLKNNLRRTSCYINHIASKPTDLSTSLWPQWLILKNYSEPQPILKLENFQFHLFNEMLVLNKDNFLKANFVFKNLKESEVDLKEDFYKTHLLIQFYNSILQKNSKTFEFSEYGSILAHKKDNGNFIIACCEGDENLIKFLYKLISSQSQAGQKFVKNITTFILENEFEIDKKKIVSNYSGNVREGFLDHQSQGSLAETLNFLKKSNLTFKSIQLKNSEVEKKISSNLLNSEVDLRITYRMATLSNSGKPPNILVYTGSDEETNSRYKSVFHVLQESLCNDRYAVYHLKKHQVNSNPWIENTLLLVLSSEEIPKKGIGEAFLAYLTSGGIILSLCSSFDQFFVEKVPSPFSYHSDVLRIIHFNYSTWKDVVVLGSNSCYADFDSLDVGGLLIEVLGREVKSNLPLIVSVTHKESSGVSLFSQISFERDSSDLPVSGEDFVNLKQSNPNRLEVLRDLLKNLGLNTERKQVTPLTPLFLYSADEKIKKNFMNLFKNGSTENIFKLNNLQFHLLEEILNKEPSEFYFPILPNFSSISSFNFETYNRNLKTKVLGKLVLYGEVVPTTMSILNSFMHVMPPDVGLAVIATTQTAGQGRGGNVWLSPKGCGLFSLHIRFPIQSPLGSRLSCFQHLIALAIVLSVRSKEGYEEIDLRIKWPNDVLYGNKLKLGGVLVRSTILHTNVHINLGCGLNISNKDPTICVNDLITQHNNLHKPKDLLPLFSIEEFIARLISQIESLINQFQEDEGRQFLHLYLKYWLHGNQLVTLNSVDGPRGTVVGVTDFGFLLVNLEDGSKVEVHPDGNSFDMMKNLIAPKLRH